MVIMIDPKGSSEISGVNLPFAPQEIAAFHRFYSYDWNADPIFQNGIKHILEASRLDQDNPIAQAQIMKAKHFYFTKRFGPINLEKYLLWEKFATAASDAKSADSLNDEFEAFDKYDFDHDENFQQGLPTIIKKLTSKGAVEKEAYDQEMTKAKLFYYSKFVKKLDIAAYMKWKKESTADTTPKCPYAHLWEGKGKSKAKPDPQLQNEDLHETASNLVEIIAPSPSTFGPTQFKLITPASQNTLTAQHVAQLSHAVTISKHNPYVTSLLLRADCGGEDIEIDPEKPITTRDTRVFSEGVDEPAWKPYYQLVEGLRTWGEGSSKPMVTWVDGYVGADAIYFAFMARLRVCTEHAYTSFSQPRANPFSGLHSLAQLPTSCPPGMALYLLYSPNLILRGPDLLLLGLADMFVPASKEESLWKNLVEVAACPPPHTVQAIRSVVEGMKAYPGPSRLDAWRKEIGDYFGNAENYDEIVAHLASSSTPWARAINDHLHGLPPLLPRLLFHAIKEASSLSFAESLKLEWRLTQRWREKGGEGTLEEYFADLGDGELELEVEDRTEDETTGAASMEATNGEAPTQSCPVSGKVGKCPVQHA
ncbi:uncharacterized protein VTP21DRAFT_10905 [Calcarisporiella thermophila]|uniref:uncharacterized protein n=1 Tax=Calcarisporiella thermophila TaxID=911321 RepID=UPI0037432ACB